MTDLRERLLHELQSNKASYVANARGASERMHAALVRAIGTHQMDSPFHSCVTCEADRWPCETLRLIAEKLEVEP